jgi:hypothetical protein
VTKDAQGKVVVFQDEDGALQIEARMAGETIWLSMTQIADLFGVNVPAISKHIKNIYATAELARKGTVSKMETVRQEGNWQVARRAEFYCPPPDARHSRAGGNPVSTA